MSATRLLRLGHLPGPREVARRQRGLRESIGRQVREHREEAAVGSVQLAVAAGIDPSYRWKIETGIANPSLDVLVALASALGDDLGVRLFPTAGPRLHDRFQAPMVDA